MSDIENRLNLVQAPLDAIEASGVDVVSLEMFRKLAEATLKVIANNVELQRQLDQIMQGAQWD